MTTATLIDGTVVDSSSEEWRLECEARHIAWHSSADIREYLDIVERHDILDHFDARSPADRRRVQQMIDQPLLVLLLLQSNDALRRQIRLQRLAGKQAVQREQHRLLQNQTAFGRVIVEHVPGDINAAAAFDHARPAVRLAARRVLM